MVLMIISHIIPLSAFTVTSSIPSLYAGVIASSIAFIGISIPAKMAGETSTAGRMKQSADAAINMIRLNLKNVVFFMKRMKKA